MPTPTSGRDPVEKLAEDFADRYRRGERPSLTEYTEKYPDLAKEIRELFPALVFMERFGSVDAPATGPLQTPLADTRPIPKQLGDFRILREVGRGGMGVVYEAVQESLGRHVALKVLPYQRLANAQSIERFRREARAAAKLHHTNIVPVFGVGEHDGMPSAPRRQQSDMRRSFSGRRSRREPRHDARDGPDYFTEIAPDPLEGELDRAREILRQLTGRPRSADHTH